MNLILGTKLRLQQRIFEGIIVVLFASVINTFRREHLSSTSIKLNQNAKIRQQRINLMAIAVTNISKFCLGVINVDVASHNYQIKVTYDKLILFWKDWVSQQSE